MSRPPVSPGGTSVVISLPMDLTYQGFLTLESSLVTSAVTAAVAFAVVLWDYFVLLPGEIKLYRSSRRGVWRSLASWGFIVLRYSAFLATFPALFLTYIANNHCQTAFIFTQVGIVLVVASSGIVFAFYALAVWDNNIIISSILVTLYAIMVGCWTAVITQYHAVTGLSVPFGSNCQIPPGVPWAPISYSSSVTFDVAVLVLVFLKLIVRRAQQSDFEYRTHSRVLAFLLITTITTITVLMIQALGSDFDLAKRSSAPFVIIITVAMGSRVFVDLRLFVEHRERTNHGLPYAANSSSQDRALSNVNYGKTVPYTTPPTAAVKSAIAQDTKKNLNPYTTFPSPPYSTSSFNISVGLPDKSKNGKSIEFSQQRKSGWV